jgi:Putative peptidoglycan binding domain
MNRWYLSTALLFCLTPMVIAQDTTATQNNNPGTAATTDATPNPPDGTKVVGHDRDTIVAPKRNPVKIDANVVKAAQNELRSRGYDPGAADGVAGPQTRAAVSKFQTDQGLTASGNLDANTLEKLNVGGTNIVKSAPADLGRGGKAFGHDIKEGHPVDAGKAMAQGSENFGKKVAKGSKSLAVRGVEKVGKGLSSIGGKVEDKAQGGDNDKDKGPDQQPSSDQQPSNQPQ